MLQYEAGKNFQDGTPEPLGFRREASRGTIRVVVLDPVLASRFLLAQAVSQPGLVVETASTIEAARAVLDRHDVALLLCDEAVEAGRGLDFLAELRETHPRTLRALISERAGSRFGRGAIERGDLSFLLIKPWSAASLRRTVREALGMGSAFADWMRVPTGIERAGGHADRRAAGAASLVGRRVLRRRLDAGLDACESLADVFALLHAELAGPFQIETCLWLDERKGLATRLEGDAPVATLLSVPSLRPSDRRAIERARRAHGISRLDPTQSDGERAGLRGAGRSAWVGVQIQGVPIHDGPIDCPAFQEESRPVATGLIFVDRTKASGLVSALRDLEASLQRTAGRIRSTRERSELARGLAERVSRELRTPMGALAHAIDRLRGEAQRAGMSTEWVDRVAWESERVARVVAHLEGELLVDSSRAAPGRV